MTFMIEPMLPKLRELVARNNGVVLEWAELARLMVEIDGVAARPSVAPACVAGGYPHMVGDDGKCVGCGGTFEPSARPKCECGTPLVCENCDHGPH